MKRYITKFVALFVVAIAAAAAADHYYVLKDGDHYGYERKLTDAEKQAGSVAPEVVMMRYAGQHGGVHQVFYYQRGGHYAEVYECAAPCEFIKVMTFARGKLVRSNRFRATPDSLGWAVMQDAMNGRLTVAKIGPDRNETAWFDEREGLVLSPIAAAK